jgi:hypothetical protein
VDVTDETRDVASNRTDIAIAHSDDLNSLAKSKPFLTPVRVSNRTLPRSTRACMR